jgi:molybdopterin synthase sulfur carrier subunit
MKLRFFGRLRDAVGEALVVDVPRHVTDSEQVRAWLGRDYPALLDPSVRIALDDRLLVAATPIAGAREIAFLPPVSGG